MTIKKSILFSLMLLLPAWPSYAESKLINNLLNNTYNDLSLNLDIGLSLSRNMGGNYENHADNSMIFGAGIKYQAFPKIKIGTNFAHRPSYEYTRIESKGDATQKFSITSYMINASYDITTIGNYLTPYTEIGMGISHIELKDYIINLYRKDRLGRNLIRKTKTFKGQTFNQFTINGGVGLLCKINNNIDIDINYKYNNFGKVKYVLKFAGTEYTYKGKIAADELMLSLRFKI
jgi:opacity protein-like surface antigen